jgi:CBS domain-containing protein
MHMLVEDVMQTDLVVCDAEESVRAAVEAMLRNHVGSVVVLADGNPAGLVTETDVLLAGYATERSFSEIPVETVMSRPLVTVAPSKSLRTAMGVMKDESIKKLPVQDGLDIVGMLTMTDINERYGEIVREIHAMEQPRGLSDAELRGLRSGEE